MLIKLVLSSIPVYCLSCFKCPSVIVRRTEKLQQDFLWNDTVETRKYHLVRWDHVCTLIANGGLGFRSISDVNKAMLGKWL